MPRTAETAQAADLHLHLSSANGERDTNCKLPLEDEPQPNVLPQSILWQVLDLIFADGALASMK